MTAEIDPLNLAQEPPVKAAPRKSRVVQETEAWQECGVPATLHGRRQGGENPIVYEKPWHRQAAYLLASGKYTQKEVAMVVGIDPSHVGHLMTQPWFNALLNTLIEKNGGKDLMDMLKAEVMASATTLIQLRDDEKVSPTVRSNIANSILDRVYGKAITRVETDTTVRSGAPVEEIAKLEQEVAALRESQKPSLS